MAFDMIIVGTGFAGAFFLRGILQHLPRTARVLVLERGGPYGDGASGGVPPDLLPERVLDLQGNAKPWIFSLAYGGGTNCWWGNTPRMLPADFETATRYGVGRDWPLGYDDLEPFYSEAETVMQISGGGETDLFPRSRPFPQPPHRATDPERILMQQHPGMMLPLPTARARRATATRPACCASSICTSCPIGAKFRVPQDIPGLFEDPRVELRLGAEVLALDMQGGTVRGVLYRDRTGEHRVQSDAVAVAANAFFNTAILLRSGIAHPMLGRRLHEQIAWAATANLKGVRNFSGSTSTTGHGYMLYDGAHRREAAACLIETWNAPALRPEPGRWLEILPMKFVFEALPRDEDRVELPDADARPRVTYDAEPDAYVLAGLDRAKRALPEILSSLPVEDVTWDSAPFSFEAHNLGTVVMGDDPATSVVDAGLRHHRLDNLFVLGGSAFPTGAPANPSLTISALSLRAADLAFGGA